MMSIKGMKVPKSIVQLKVLTFGHILRKGFGMVFAVMTEFKNLWFATF